MYSTFEEELSRGLHESDLEATITVRARAHLRHNSINRKTPSALLPCIVFRYSRDRVLSIAKKKKAEAYRPGDKRGKRGTESRGRRRRRMQVQGTARGGAFGKFAGNDVGSLRRRYDTKLRHGRFFFRPSRARIFAPRGIPSEVGSPTKFLVK